MAKFSCATCRFRADRDGTCRRYPPSVTVLMVPVGKLQQSFAAQTFVAFPSCADDVWCGEWQADVPTLQLVS
jgi:hypothetical protein